MKHILAAILAVLATQSHAGDWSDADTAREVVFVGTLVLDYKQTKDIKRHDWAYETNPIMGKNPSDTRVAGYFLAAGAAHYAVARALPAGWPREAWQYGWIAAQVVQVAKNKRIGLHFNF